MKQSVLDYIVFNFKNTLFDALLIISKFYQRYAQQRMHQCLIISWKKQILYCQGRCRLDLDLEKRNL